MKLKFLTILCLFGTYVFAQVNTAKNISIILKDGKHKKFSREASYEIAAPNADEIKQHDAHFYKGFDRTSAPFRFAEPIKVNIDVIKEADWLVDSGFAYGKFTVKIKDAKSLSFNTNNFFFPKNTEIWIYNDSGRIITGPVTETENNKTDLWGSAIYPEDKFTIEIKIPNHEKQDIKLNISNIAYGYKDFGDFGGAGDGFDGSEDCEVNVLCPTGNGWNKEINSVAKIISGDGSSNFTGAMINNACNLNIPYMLTCYHTFHDPDYPVDASSLRIYFKYWSPICSPSQDNYNVLLFNGAAIKAQNAASDFALLLLNQTPSPDQNIYYAGWNRSSNPATNTTCIHHPSGDVMKISTDANPPSLHTYNTSALDHWRANFQVGTVERGSSGSPLFDQNHRIIGQLHGNSTSNYPINTYCDEHIGDFGRFDLSWTGEGTPSTRLSDWLDPNNTGVTTVDAVSNSQYVIQGADNFCSGLQTYSLLNLPSGSTVTSWSVSPSGIVSQPSPSSGPQTSLSFIANGVATLTATISNGITGCGNIQVQKTVQAGAGNAPNVNVSYDANCGSFLEGLVIATNPLTPIGTIGYRWTVDYSTVYNTLLTDQNGGDLLLQPFATPPRNGTSKHFLQVQANTACGLTAFNPYINVINIGPCTPGNGGGFINKIGQPTETNAVSSKIANVKLAVFPNPAHASLYITVPKDSIDMKHAFIKISDVYGKQLKTIPAASESNTIDVGNLASGVYIVEITDGKKRIVKKIIVQH